MGAQATRGPSARQAEPLADVLVSGADEPAWRPSRAQQLAAAALVLAGVVALAVPGTLSDDAARGAASPDLALREGATALPRRASGPVGDRVEGGVHVELVNEGSKAVRLLSGTVSPGEWQVTVVDDLDHAADPDGTGRLLRPGWHAVVVLHRSVRCSSAVDHGPVPTSLTLEVEVGGRPRTASLDLGPDRGGLSDLLGAPERFCAAGGTAAAGTAGDPGLPFLPLWIAGTGVLPSP